MKKFQLPVRFLVLIGIVALRAIDILLVAIGVSSIFRVLIVAAVACGATIALVLIGSKQNRHEAQASEAKATSPTETVHTEAKKDIILFIALLALVIIDALLTRHGVSFFSIVVVLFFIAQAFYRYISPQRVVEEVAERNLARKSRTKKLPSAWRLFRTALREFRTDWKPYAKILAVVALPTNLINLIPSFASDPSVSPYLSLAAVVMNVALLWAIVQRHEAGKVPGVARTYYEGTAPFIRYVLATVLLVLMLIPAAFGSSLFLTALLGGAAAGSTGMELALVGLVALIFALPSFWLLIRYGLAPLVVIREHLRPVASLRRARRLTLGHFWGVAARFVLLIVFLALLSLPITLVTILLSIVKLSALGVVIFEIVSTLTALPIANLYLLALYRELEGSGESTS
jgi:hypothetical protein